MQSYVHWRPHIETRFKIRQEDMLFCKKNLQIWCRICIRHHGIMSGEVSLESLCCIDIYDPKSTALCRAEFSGPHLPLLCRWHIVFSREIGRFQQLFSPLQKKSIGELKWDQGEEIRMTEDTKKTLFWKIRPFFTLERRLRNRMQ